MPVSTTIEFSGPVSTTVEIDFLTTRELISDPGFDDASAWTIAQVAGGGTTDIIIQNSELQKGTADNAFVEIRIPVSITPGNTYTLTITASDAWGVGLELEAYLGDVAGASTQTIPVNLGENSVNITANSENSLLTLFVSSSAEPFVLTDISLIES